MTYDVHVRLTGKLLMDFLFVLIEHFTQGFTADAIWANTDCKSVFWRGVSFSQIFTW